MDSLTLKRHNSFQNQNNRNATHSFAPRPLSFKFQHEVLEFNNICVRWSSPLGDIFDFPVTANKSQNVSSFSYLLFTASDNMYFFTLLLIKSP